MIASFINGIKSAFETNPGTSCEVVTSNESTSVRVHPKPMVLTFTTCLCKGA